LWQFIQKMTTMKPLIPTKTNTLQTLDRGLQALTVVATHTGGISIAQLAAELEVHRAIAYRLVTTLEMHGLIARMQDGRIVTGAGVLRLSATFESQFRALAQPYLMQLAQEASATAFITVAQGDECTAIQVCEPQSLDLRMSYRIGSRHAIDTGAAGIAILAARPASAADLPAVKQARKQGYSITHGELQKGAVGIACAIQQAGALGSRSAFEACVGVVAMEDLDTPACAKRVMDCASELAKALSSS
jgi:DNA-binding IclR family transcriptional regulator